MFIKYFFIWILLSLPLVFAGYLVWFMSRGGAKKEDPMKIKQPDNEDH